MDLSGRVINSILIFILFFLVTMASGQAVENSGSSGALYQGMFLPDKPLFMDKMTTPDKAQHFMGSLISSVLIYKICREPLDMPKSNSKIFATGLTLGLGISKELYDRSQSKGLFSWRDLLADLAGIGVGLILINQP